MEASLLTRWLLLMARVTSEEVSLLTELTSEALMPSDRRSPLLIEVLRAFYAWGAWGAWWDPIGGF